MDKEENKINQPNQVELIYKGQKVLFNINVCEEQNEEMYAEPQNELTIDVSKILETNGENYESDPRN